MATRQHPAAPKTQETSDPEPAGRESTVHAHAGPEEHHHGQPAPRANYPAPKLQLRQSDQITPELPADQQRLPQSQPLCRIYDAPPIPPIFRDVATQNHDYPSKLPAIR